MVNIVLSIVRAKVPVLSEAEKIAKFLGLNLQFLDGRMLETAGLFVQILETLIS